MIRGSKWFSGECQENEPTDAAKHDKNSAKNSQKKNERKEMKKEGEGKSRECLSFILAEIVFYFMSHKS